MSYLSRTLDQLGGDRAEASRIGDHTVVDTPDLCYEVGRGIYLGHRNPLPARLAANAQ